MLRSVIRVCMCAEPLLRNHQEIEILGEEYAISQVMGQRLLLAWPYKGVSANNVTAITRVSTMKVCGSISSQL